MTARFRVHKCNVEHVKQRRLGSGNGLIRHDRTRFHGPKPPWGPWGFDFLRAVGCWSRVDDHGGNMCFLFPSFPLGTSFWILDGFGSELRPLGCTPGAGHGPDTICSDSLSEIDIKGGHSYANQAVAARVFSSGFSNALSGTLGQTQLHRHIEGLFGGGPAMRGEMEKGLKATTSPLLFSRSSAPHDSTPVFMPLRRQACRVIWIISKRLPSVGEGEVADRGCCTYQKDIIIMVAFWCFFGALPTRH